MPAQPNRWIFQAFDSINGTELWITDGTAAGTRLLKNINPGSGNSLPQFLSPFGSDHLLFSAADSTNGRELWITDGTSAGTQLVKNLNPATASSSPQNFTDLGNGTALFTATSGTGAELWLTDGTEAGTQLLKDLFPGANGSSPQNFTALGNGQWLFTADDGTSGRELWVTDGTADGTVQVRDIFTGSSASTPLQITPIGNGRALFNATSATGGAELWITDGTANGTLQVRDILPGTEGSDPQSFTALGAGKWLFVADDNADGAELWVTDGTTQGTALVTNIAAGAVSSFPLNLTALGNGKAVFTADDGTNGTELWITDGSAAGTLLVKDIAPGIAGSSILFVTALGGGKAVFRANDGLSGAELWVTDGTSAGTHLVMDIRTGAGGSAPQFITAIGDGKALFRANNGSSGTELWITDGTIAGTQLVKDINAGVSNSSPTGFTGIFVPNHSPVLNGPVATLPPGLEDQSYIVTPDQLLQGYSDPDGDTLTITGLTVDRGSLTHNGDGSWTYHPETDYSGSVSFAYSVSDGHGGAAPASLDLTLQPVNDAPVAHADSLAAVEDTAITFTAAQLLGNDTDAEGDLLTIAGVVSGVGGSVVLNADGSVTFTPAADFNGAASFSYSTIDGTSTSAPVTVTVDVAPVNDPAVIGGVFTGSLGEDAEPNSTSGALTITDLDSPAAFQAVTVPTVSDNGYGSFTVTAEGVWTYILNNANATVDALNTGEQLIDTFSVLSADGTVRQIAVTIAGHTDNPAAAPTDIRWGGIDSGDGALPLAGAPMAMLGTADADSSTFNYALQPGSSAGFSITGDTVSPIAALATGQTYTLIVSSTDSTSRTYSETFTVITGTAAAAGMAGSAGDDAIYALGGNDTLTGGTGDDVVYGGDGTDIFLASLGDGNDTYIGGTGTDTYSLANTTAEATVDLGAGTATSTQTGSDTLATIENVTGGSGADLLIGSAGVANRLAGGLGNDTYQVQDTTDVVFEAAGQGMDTVFASVSYTLSTAIEQLVLTGTGHINGTGSAAPNTLIGNSGHNVLDGGAGVDTMAGGLGNDTYVKDLGGDVVTELAGEGTDTVLSATSLTLGANLENATLTGTANIAATGNAADNVITGNSGNNQLNGIGGVDVLIGGGGNDTFMATVTATGAVEDTIVAGSGIDTLLLYGAATLATAATIVATAALDNVSISGTGMTLLNVTGNELANTLTGNGAANVLSGGVGNDTLVGGGGADRLVGGTGIDTLTGGTARDTFAFAAGDGNALSATVDRITDLVKGGVGTGDLIDYTAALTRGGSALAATTTDASISQSTGVATFADGSGGTLADAVSDIAARFTAAGDAAGEFALFQVSGAGNYHAFISDGVAGAGANDVVVELVGVTTVGQISLAGGNLTIIA